VSSDGYVDGSSVGISARLSRALDAELAGATALRHELHAQPELSGSEELTRRIVLGRLPGTEITEAADTGALVRIGGPGPAIAIRAELDALPIKEATGVPWAAANGAMHACGHDVHLAAVAAVARCLHRTGGPMPLLVVLQPREETYPSGARDMTSSGALAPHDVRAMIGAHVQPVLPDGVVSCDGGVVNAAADEFVVTMRGRGGHAAYPHLTADPVLALAQFALSAQQIVSRTADPIVPTVVTIGSVHAGDAANATPEIATARGTLRTMSQAQRPLLQERLAEIANGVAMTHGCTAEVTVLPGEPPLRNDARLAEVTSRQLSQLGLGMGGPLHSCGADDFAYFTEVIPALMMFVGVGDGSSMRLHDHEFLPPDETVRNTALALLAGYLAAAEIFGERPSTAARGLTAASAR
jgi:amidohydrolase